MTGQQILPFAEQLRRYRRDRGLTQEELAEQAALSARGIRALEQGERSSPHKDTVRLLADALGLTSEEKEAFDAAARSIAVSPDATNEKELPSPFRSSRWNSAKRQSIGTESINRRLTYRVAVVVLLIAAAGITGGMMVQRLQGSASPPVRIGHPVAGWWEHVRAMEHLDYPVAVTVDHQGDVYVLDKNDSSVHEFSPSGEPILTWGSTGTRSGAFINPSDIAIDSGGHVYVADTGNDRIQKFSASGQWLRSWGSPGSRTGQLESPTALAIDATDHVYVSDTGNNRVVAFTPGGNQRETWGTNGYLQGPTALAIDSRGNLYVVNTGGRIQQFSRDGTPRNQWTGIELGPTLSGVSLTIGPDGNVWEAGGGAILEFSPDGKALGSIYALKTRYLEDITVDRHGDMYVADAGGREVVKVSADGAVLSRFGAAPSAKTVRPVPRAVTTDASDIYVAVGNQILRYSLGRDRLSIWTLAALSATSGGPLGLAIGANGVIYVASGADDKIVIVSRDGHVTGGWGIQGAGPGEFNVPSAVAVDSAGNVYVADSGNARVQKFSHDGVFIASWALTKYGNGSGGAPYPTALVLDSHDNVYVADGVRGSVLEVAPSGRLLHAWGSRGTGLGQFRAPDGLAIDRSGHLYVVDTANNRVEVLSPSGAVVATVGNQGHGPGQFDRPLSAAVSSTGDLYVADTGNSRVQKFSSTVR